MVRAAIGFVIGAVIVHTFAIPLWVVAIAAGLYVWWLSYDTT